MGHVWGDTSGTFSRLFLTLWLPEPTLGAVSTLSWWFPSSCTFQLSLSAVPTQEVNESPQLCPVPGIWGLSAKSVQSLHWSKEGEDKMNHGDRESVGARLLASPPMGCDTKDTSHRCQVQWGALWHILWGHCHLASTALPWAAGQDTWEE